MYKKVLSITLALLICFGCAGALAAEERTVFDMPAVGMRFVFPEAYEDAKGWIGTDGVMELSGGSYYLYFYYCAVPREEFDRMYVEEPNELSARACVLFYAFAVGGGKDFSEVTRLTNGSMTEDDAVKLGQEGDYTFYLYLTENAGFAASLDEDYREEYCVLSAQRDETAAGFTCFRPVNEYTDLDGSVIHFEATDFDGNPVSSEELFSKHAVTLVNIWATWCGPCIGELKELQAIHTRFLEKDCAVVGLLTDDDFEAARRLMEENGVTYDVVFVKSSLSFVFPYSAVPTSFFVDRDGVFLGTKFVGVYPDMYESALEPLLQP